MSTRELRHALNLLEEALGGVPAVELARSELEAIERAARSVSMFASPESEDIGATAPSQEQLEHDLRLLRAIAKESKP